MENHSQQSYPNSGESSPHSRDIDCDNSPSCNDPAVCYKVKFMCSYGGKIQPRAHDNQLSYVGGDTKILAIERNSKFTAVIAKLSSLCDSAPSLFCFKYQLPGEDLDALISVTNDEDVEHMMIEYDRLCKSSVKPARLRMFLFPLNQKANSRPFEFKEAKPEGNWFIDTLNPVQLRPLDVSSPPVQVNSEQVNPDFLFGFDKATPPSHKVSDPNPVATNLSDLDDKTDSAEPVTTFESKMEKLQIDEEIDISLEDVKPKDNPTERYTVQEKVAPATMPTSAYYWQEKQISPRNHPISGTVPMDQQPIYIIQNLPGMYHQNPSVQSASGVQPGQGYYSMSHVIPDVYCEHSMYNTVQSSMIQSPRVTPMQDGIGVVRQPSPAPGMMAEQGYKVYYDYAGRPLYYAVPVNGLAPSQPQQTTAAVMDVRSVAPDCEVAGGNLPQNTSL